MRVGGLPIPLHRATAVRPQGCLARSLHFQTFLCNCSVPSARMASVSASLPVYMLPGIPVTQPAHLEGDPSLATEILPGPPSVTSVQQALQKKDPRKPASILSYLPTSDPGTTYTGYAHATPVMHVNPPEPDGPRRKRARIDKGSVSISSQFARALLMVCSRLFRLSVGNHSLRRYLEPLRDTPAALRPLPLSDSHCGPSVLPHDHSPHSSNQ
jgi:hypothetical protein